MAVSHRAGSRRSSQPSSCRPSQRLSRRPSRRKAWRAAAIAVGILWVGHPHTIAIAQQGTSRGASPDARARELASAQAAALPPPVELTAQQDHRRLLDLLQIPTLRRGPDGNPSSPNAANRDETKANPYPDLPAPLIFKNGRNVMTPQDWTVRRLEILEEFDREVYGRVPKVTPQVTWEVTSRTEETSPGVNGEVPVVRKQLVGHADNAAYPQIAVDIQLTLVTPANAKGPVPVIMEFSFGPRRPAAATTPPAGGTAGGAGSAPATAPAPATGTATAAPAGNAAGGPPGGAPAGLTWQQQVLAKGWGYATIVPSSIQADNGAGLTRGIIGLVNKGQPRGLDEWGALRAWAWGASRALDYFETDPAVDARRVGIEGLSRYGKAAVVTMAYDTRFAIAFVVSSGAGGVKLHRRHFGEQVENVAGQGEYHWMAGHYLKYAGPLTPNDLPVDSHELVALCAPRPVFISAGSLEVEGGWIDAKGMFLAGVGAGPVYRLLGKKDLGATEFPPQETALVDGEIAFRQHAGGHTAGPNWPTFLTFATRYFEPPAR